MSRRLALFLLAIFFGLSLAACTASEPTASTHGLIPSSSASSSVKDSSTPVPHIMATDTAVPVLTQDAYFVQTIQAKLGPTWTPDPNQIYDAQTLIAQENPTSTPLPPTPTFGIYRIQTSTPAPPASCPQSLLDPKQVPTLEYNGQDWTSTYLDYLNQFGAKALLLADQLYRDRDGNLDPSIVLHRDLTNDGVPEIVVSFSQFDIFGCKNGQYTTLLQLGDSFWPPKIVAITDLNQNGMPELLVRTFLGSEGETRYQLFEWGDGKFNDLFGYYNSDMGEQDNDVGLLPGGTISFRDVDQDSMKEIVLKQGFWLAPDLICDTAPLRKSTEYYKWNGQNFVFYKMIFDPPQYRFQAVEDADHDVLDREYDQALALYQRVIFDNRLEWWTNARKDYIYSCNGYSNPPSTTPPSPDPNEYQYQAAYARFRIMVLHLMHGYQSDAQVVYQTLLKKFPDGTPGSVYADMAQAFWGEYQTSHSLVQACGKSQDVASHRLDEATRYLLDNYGYDGTVNYTLQQLCPF
jgi:hypothetical protein